MHSPAQQDVSDEEHLAHLGLQPVRSVPHLYIGNLGSITFLLLGLACRKDRLFGILRLSRPEQVQTVPAVIASDNS